MAGARRHHLAVVLVGGLPGPGCPGLRHHWVEIPTGGLHHTRRAAAHRLLHVSIPTTQYQSPFDKKGKNRGYGALSNLVEEA